MKYSLAEHINTYVNNSILPIEDIKHFGKLEYWSVDWKSGDCDEYLLTKREMLFKAGVDPREISIVACFLHNGEGHGVLYVETDKGNFILDNLHPLPMPPNNLNYKWHSIQRGDKWYELHGFA